MAVVLRRADSARATATNVDRLMSSTALDVDSKWIAKLDLKKADVEPMLKEIGSDLDYVPPIPKNKNAKLRVVQAEAWAKVLSELCPNESKFPNLFAAISADTGAAFADIAGQAKTLAKLNGEIKAE
jgi:hypothetical protein